ncbi:MAG: TRAP transporter fused permease subunit [Rickettsiales bacterium]|nr:TRAP transporter fused permease subunit [Rickettsiales bacterium]
MSEDVTITQTAPSNALDKVVFPAMFAIAAFLSCFHLYQSVTTELGSTFFRPIHLSWILVLIYMKYPLIKITESPLYFPGRLVDLACCGLAIYGGLSVVNFDYTGIDHLLNGLNEFDYIAGVGVLFLVLEGTRRAVGWEMALIGSIFVLYALFGNLLPDEIANRGFSLERLVRFQIFTSEGVYGAPLGIAATAVFMFVLFGAFLESTGAGKFFIDLSYAAAGKYRGGPAKACVVASAGMGSISGSAIANAVAVGALTIPMMKKLGYKPEQAAGIEASASTGGQIMPPIMGAGAFIMAEFTNTAYRDIVLISIVPALLYFTSVLLYVHLMACKLGLKGVEDRPKIRDILIYGFHFILPLGLITGLLMMNYSPTLVGAVGTAAVLVACMMRKHTRIGFNALYAGLRGGAMMMLPISAACATAGIVVGVIGQTGLGLQFTEFVLSLSGGSLWLALILVAFAALILGMGLPVTAAYIILAVMAAPALETMGVYLLTAHMAIFWLSQTSNITPPVALAAFAAAGVANAKPQRSAIESLKLSNGFFLIPVMMLYSDLLFVDDVTWTEFGLAVAVSFSIVFSLAYAIEGFASTYTTKLQRVLFFVAVPLLVYNSIETSILGIIIFLITAFWNKLTLTRSISTATS